MYNAFQAITFILLMLSLAVIIVLGLLLTALCCWYIKIRQGLKEEIIDELSHAISTEKLRDTSL